MLSHAAAFIDRDGTLIRDVGYLRHIHQIQVLPRVTEGLSLLRRQGLKTVLVTNQSAVGRGFLSEDQLHSIHEELQRLVGCFDGVYYCPHHPTAAMGPYRRECECRKPNGGMVRKASRDLNLDPSVSYVIGDQMSDMFMAERVGAKGILVGGPGNAPTEVFETKRDFYAAVEWILKATANG